MTGNRPKERAEIAELLIKKHAQHVTDESGITPVEYAISRGLDQVACLLLHSKIRNTSHLQPGKDKSSDSQFLTERYDLPARITLLKAAFEKRLQGVISCLLHFPDHMKKQNLPPKNSFTGLDLIATIEKTNLSLLTMIISSMKNIRGIFHLKQDEKTMNDIMITLLHQRNYCGFPPVNSDDLPKELKNDRWSIVVDEFDDKVHHDMEQKYGSRGPCNWFFQYLLKKYPPLKDTLGTGSLYDGQFVSILPLMPFW